VEFVVGERRQLVERAGVAVPPPAEELGDIAHRVGTF